MRSPYLSAHYSSIDHLADARVRALGVRVRAHAREAEVGPGA